VQRTKALSFSEKQESLDLKKAMLPVVGFARVYALKYKIKETNTVERLKGIMFTDKLNKTFIQEIINAYEYLLFLRFRFQTQKILSNENPDNLLPVEELTNMEKTSVKAALSEIAELYTQLGFDFEGA
jgi:CBS domain-containing protein